MRTQMASLLNGHQEPQRLRSSIILVIQVLGKETEEEGKMRSGMLGHLLMRKEGLSLLGMSGNQ